MLQGPAPRPGVDQKPDGDVSVQSVEDSSDLARVAGKRRTFEGGQSPSLNLDWQLAPSPGAAVGAGIAPQGGIGGRKFRGQTDGGIDLIDLPIKQVPENDFLEPTRLLTAFMSASMRPYQPSISLTIVASSASAKVCISMGGRGSLTPFGLRFGMRTSPSTSGAEVFAPGANSQQVNRGSARGRMKAFARKNLRAADRQLDRLHEHCRRHSVMHIMRAALAPARAGSRHKGYGS